MQDNSFELMMEGHLPPHHHLLGGGGGVGPPLHRPPISALAPVPQRLFANWEMDRAHTSTVQRVFTLSISRLALFPCPSQMRALVITAKLEGYKRSLRSNEIVLGEGGLGAIDLPLDISFTIQYPHFLKHKSNVMQIHVQRKRKYKNRPIPGGFKGVAYGSIDLTAMLQSGGAAKSEISLYATPTSKQQQHQIAVTSMGRMVMQSCGTLPLEAEGDTTGGGGSAAGGATGAGGKHAKDKGVELSDDSECSDEEDSDLVNDGAPNSGRSGGGGRTPAGTASAAAEGGEHRLRDSQRRRKRAQHKKNMKQRLVNLLKKLRGPDEGGNEAAASSTGREPTAKELQALFDELDELSDSGNEGVAADEISITSNPRPALRPYFSSREPLPLPAIEDERASESEGEDVEWSSETEAAAVAAGIVGGAQWTPRAAHNTTLEPPADPTTPSGHQTPFPSSPWKSSLGTGASPVSIPPGGRGGEGGGETTATSSMIMTHSVTAGSIAAMREKEKVARNASLSDQLYAILSTSDAAAAATSGAANAAAAAASAAGAASECIWLCQFPDDSMLSSLSGAHDSAAAAAAVAANSNSSSARPLPPLHLIAANSARDVRAAIQQIVAKIQMFCNSNSAAPSITWIGVMGTDRLVSQVLRAYVDVLQHKSSSSWLQYLRFLLVVPPSSHVGRLLACHDSALEQLSRDIWERWAELSPTAHAAVAERLCTWPIRGGVSGGGGVAPALNLLIGEALVQLNTKDAKELAVDGNDRLFVPFLSEVRLCGEEEALGGLVSAAASASSPFHPGGSSAPSPRAPSIAASASAAVDQSAAANFPDVVETRFQLQQGQSSPPASPHTKGANSESRGEVQVEYWVSKGEGGGVMGMVGGGGGARGEETILAPLMPGQLPTTPGGKKDKENNKESMKCHMKVLAISRPSNAPLLKLQFVKEKKKDKMFQKLGMKNKSKNDVEASPSVIVNISRLLCSAQGKHSLTVLVDGCAYNDVRFFSTSSQWQTHVKYFPVGLMTPHHAL